MVTTPDQPELPGVPPAPAPPSLGPGVYSDVPAAAYHADPCLTPSLSHSIALDLLRSPAHARMRHPRLGGQGRERTAPMRQGSILDSLILGGDAKLITRPPVPDMLPDASGKMVATRGELRLASAKAWAAEQDALVAAQEAAGAIVCSADEIERYSTAAERIKQGFAERWGLRFDGMNQLTVVWEDDSAGGGPPVLCRGRLDHWLEEWQRPGEPGAMPTIVDLKIVENADPEGIAAKFHAFGYDVQWAAYTTAMGDARPELAGRIRMVFAFAEPKPPYETLVVTAAGSMRALGLFRWRKALRTWRECLEEGRWPGYQAPPNGIEARPWALAEMEQVVAGGSLGTPF